MGEHLSAAAEAVPPFAEHSRRGPGMGQVDREITDLAPWVPFVSMRIADFTSAGAGNYQYNPIWGILLDQLWVR